MLGEILVKLRATPGITAAASGWWPPLFAGSGWHFASPGTEPGPTVRTNAITDGFLEVLRVPLIAGRTLTHAESVAPRSASVVPVVVNQRFAEVMFGGANPVGRTLTSDRRTRVTFEVVGLVGNQRTSDVRAEAPPFLYEPLGVSPPTTTMIVRSALSAGEVAVIARRVAAEVDPAVPLDMVRELSVDIDTALTEERLFARLGAVLASLAALLSIAGLYAVVTSFVTERTREFGIQLALGASRAHVATGILRRVIVYCGIGFAAGAAGVALLGPYIASRLYGVTALDARTMAGAMFLLTSTALTAAWLPARRASRIDPAVTLRAQ